MRISKSKFVSGVQCLKRLYLQVHRPELAAELDDASKAAIGVLTRSGRFGHNLIEVKSATKVKPHYAYNVAIPRHVLTGAGIEPNGPLKQFREAALRLAAPLFHTLRSHLKRNAFRYSMVDIRT
jgi:hypothetical protein